jgi:trk system potassium uptake protein TrkH
VRFWKSERITPAQIIITGFIILMITGTALLMLPFATLTPGGASFSDAIFTATSATCVTGLVVHDTVLYWSTFGQVVILILIQIGGMGVVTFAVAITMFAGKKISWKQRWVMQESIAAPQVGGIVRLTRFILKGVFFIEGFGALLLALRFCPKMGLGRGLWYAVFHSISAFCNAGFDLMGMNGSYSSMTSYIADPWINGILIALIVIGGIGFLTWHDVWEHKLNFRVYRLQSKIILIVTITLIILSALYLFLYEFSLPQWQSLTLGERTQAAFFQAITPRTAGFNTIDLTRMSRLGQLIIILLMLSGGAPGSTAGGFKITTLAVLFLSTWAVVCRKPSTQCCGRRIPEEALRSGVTIFLLYLLLFLTGGMLICSMEGVPLMAALFEAASAIGTVGLSLGITTQIGLISKVILIFLMYFGRVGGLTLVYAFTAHEMPSQGQLPREGISVG